MDERTTVEGVIEEIVFSNEVNGYTVCDIKCDKGIITAVGYMPFISEGELLKVTGKWVNHPDYGEQLKVELYEKMLPHTSDGIEKYLASGIIKGVGPATAAKIVDRFGAETMDIIRFRPEMLSEIKGINHQKALKIGQAFEEQRELMSVAMFLQEYGISPSYSAAIYKAFGDKTVQEIKKNPYRLADEIFGIGFKTADRIAMSMGIDPASRYRVCSGIKYVLSQASGRGHTFVPSEKLKEYTSQLLDVGIESLDDALVTLVMEKAVCTERNSDCDRVYLSSLYHSEIGVCRKMYELLSVDFSNEYEDADGIIDDIQLDEGIQLADMQKEAIKEALTNGITIITGGPGTGKTTIIKSIIKLFQRKGSRVALAAPTGRAAKRMSEATGFEARTIHRLLEIGYMGQDNELVFMKTEADPIDADVVIIDETSMVDVVLMNHLLKAVAPGTRLILVGDINQLPSVGPGNVLKDLISSGLINTVMLTEIFRQAEESLIIVNAHRINKGERPCINRKDKDFFFISRNSAQGIVGTIVDLCASRIPQGFGFDPIRQIQVLTPTKKGPSGVYNLNVELQKALNPQRKNKNEKAFRDFVYREGDRVMQIKNNYNLRWRKESGDASEGMGVFNGDTGVIRRIDTVEQCVEVLFEDDKVVEYDFSILEEIEPAFAITIHKSQGSEYPAIIIPVFSGPQILMTRNLLYTAVTRARNIVVIVGSENSMYDMINNEREALRFSGLSEKLQLCINGMSRDVWRAE